MYCKTLTFSYTLILQFYLYIYFCALHFALA